MCLFSKYINQWRHSSNGINSTTSNSNQSEQKLKTGFGCRRTYFLITANRLTHSVSGSFSQHFRCRFNKNTILMYLTLIQFFFFIFVIVCSVYYFRKEQFMEKNKTKKLNKLQKQRKNENYERMNEMQTRDRNEAKKMVVFV